jgi:hypothetical protein
VVVDLILDVMGPKTSCFGESSGKFSLFLKWVTEIEQNVKFGSRVSQSPVFTLVGKGLNKQFSFILQQNQEAHHHVVIVLYFNNRTSSSNSSPSIDELLLT